MKTFRDYYKNPEYRIQHLRKLNKKVQCECGFMTSMVNLKRHQKSSNHQKRMMGFSLADLFAMKKRIEIAIKQMSS